MKKLIEKQESMSVVCDNKKCDYTISIKPKHLYLFLATKCPKCDEPLLTQKDYEAYLKIIVIVDFINKWFSWITLFQSKKTIDNTKKISVHYHDGEITSKIVD